MKSHAYNFTFRDVARLAFLPLLLSVLFAIFMLASSSVLPPPKPILDVDRTILLHQADASQTRTDAEIILIGDSSCLMNVNARQLELLSGKRVVNLGTLSHVSLDLHAALLNQNLRSNAQPRTIVLLMHPESLRLASRVPYFDGIIRAYLKKRDSWDGDMTFLRLTGAETFRDRILTRVLPLPLAGEYGQHYGFNQNLWNHLTENNGSVLDPHEYPSTPPAGNPEYRLAPQLQTSANQFRSNLPPHIRLVVGLTPSPTDYVLSNHSENARAILATWSHWLKADITLTNLPFTLHPTHFATSTHLNSHGVTHYTQLLATDLTNRLNSPTALSPP